MSNRRDAVSIPAKPWTPESRADAGQNHGPSEARDSILRASPQVEPGIETASRQIPKIIFFGNGPLSEYTLKTLAPDFDLLFHARTKEDLATARELKLKNPDALGILASFGVLIKPDFLELFEPIGILNLHPSLLPKYRGASPIESAILAGDTDFSYSIMKLSEKMDAGPIYYQTTLKNLPLDKSEIYCKLATAGAEWLVKTLSPTPTNSSAPAEKTALAKKTAPAKKTTPTEKTPAFENLPAPVPQDDSAATYTKKLEKSLSFLRPNEKTADELFREIVAYQGFPKPKYEFFGKTCIILEAHVLRVTDILCEAAGLDGSSPLMLKCADHNFVVIDRLQPKGKKPMDARSFGNGYAKPKKP